MARDADDQVFVAIASYRDAELATTIENCVATAERPERLRFGVCLQHDATGPPEVRPDCLDQVDANIDVVAFDWTESRGGCWARHQAQGLYGGEAYTMQIDSHMRMQPGWDSLLVEMVERFPGDKPLITGHCPLYSVVEGRDVYPPEVPPVPATVATEMLPNQWINHPALGESVDDIVPRPTRFLSGMFVFTRGSWNVEVRQDPEHLYSGEELALTIRSFTHGYDLYNPDRVVAWHRHHPGGNVRYIGVAPDAEVGFRTERAFRRLRALFRGDPERVLAPYGPGDERSVDEYTSWAGFDVDTLTISEAARTGATPDVFRRSPERESAVVADTPPHRSGSDEAQHTDRFVDRRIRLTIASVRDPELGATVRSAISRADHPEHLRFAICLLHDDGTADPLEPWADDPRFRVEAVPYDESRDEEWAVARASALHDDEPYALHIDGNTRLSDGWDTDLVATRQPAVGHGVEIGRIRIAGSMFEAADSSGSFVIVFFDADGAEVERRELALDRTDAQSYESVTVHGVDLGAVEGYVVIPALGGRSIGPVRLHR